MGLNQLVVTNPGTASYADSSNPVAFAGKQGETLTSNLHGKYYTGAYRSKVFSATTTVSGTIIPVSNATASTFGIYNPLGSGINVELISYDLGAIVITMVVSPILMGVNQSILINPVGVTTLTSVPAVMGSGASSVAKAYSAATVVASTLFYTIGHITSVNTTVDQTPRGNFHYEFNGMLNLGPGTIAHVVGTAAQSQAMQQSLMWAEWPV